MKKKIDLFLHLQNFKGHRWATLFKVLLLHRKKIYHHVKLCKEDFKDSAFNHALGSYFARKLSLEELAILFEYLNTKNVSK